MDHGLGPEERRDGQRFVDPDDRSVDDVHGQQCGAEVVMDLFGEVDDPGRRCSQALDDAVAPPHSSMNADSRAVSIANALSYVAGRPASTSRVVAASRSSFVVRWAMISSAFHSSAGGGPKSPSIAVSITA